MPPESTPETIAKRLRANEPAIDEAIFQKVRASVPDTVGDDPEYESGLYAAVVEAVDHCIKVIEAGTRVLVPFPAATLEQARRAARRGVDIKTVGHRVQVGERMVRAFATKEADDLPARDLARVLDSLGPAIDRLVDAVGDEHTRERERMDCGADARRDEVIERLLAGERPGPLDEAIVRYPFGGWHLGVVGAGRDVEGALGHLAETLGCRLLVFHRDPAATSSWLGGGRRRLTFADVRGHPALNRGADVTVAVGEPGEGLEGWRRTHEQARIALLPGSRRSGSLTRAADVLAEAILSKDRAAARLLVATYLSPLDSLQGNGEEARETLRFYFAHGHNVSTTARALGIHRSTVANRLRKIELATGGPLSHEIMTRLELALKVEEELARSTGDTPPL